MLIVCISFFLSIILYCTVFSFHFVDYDECASDPCQNGGECVDQVNKFICECTGDFDGMYLNQILSSQLCIM